MRVEVATDLSDSAHDFLRVVWPVVKRWCRGGELQPVEAIAPKDFEKKLDILSGIDAWQIVTGEGIRGISSRVQWVNGDSFWQTFTIRKSRATGSTTEWEKRIKALSDTSGFIRPALLVHAYVQKPRRFGRLKYVCMCRADDLFALATDKKMGSIDEMQSRAYEGYRREYAWYEKANPQDGNTFAVFPVDALRGHRVKVKEFTERRARDRCQ